MEGRVGGQDPGVTQHLGPWTGVESRASTHRHCALLSATLCPGFLAARSPVQAAGKALYLLAFSLKKRRSPESALRLLRLPLRHLLLSTCSHTTTWPNRYRSSPASAIRLSNHPEASP